MKISLNIAFRRGFERDGAKTSEFFKLQKIRTVEELIFKEIPKFMAKGDGHRKEKKKPKKKK